MTKWTPEQSAMMHERGEEISAKLRDVIKREAPSTREAWNAVLHGICSVLYATVMSAGTDPAKLMEEVTSKLQRAVDDELGGTKH